MEQGYEISLNTQKALETCDEAFLDTQGRLRLLPAETYRRVDPASLRVWMHYRARYLLPTFELVAWLEEEINGRKAIEVASGNGDLAFHLGIKATDSYCQICHPAARLFYALGKQVPTRPTPDVYKLDAQQAINKFHPEVVVASWLTRKFIVGTDEDGISDASVLGPEEEWIFKRVEKYIHIGSETVHGTKTLLSVPHRTEKYPWLISRANYTDPNSNVIYIWEK